MLELCDLICLISLVEVFEEMSIRESCRELNDVPFEIRLKTLERELIETLEGY